MLRYHVKWAVDERLFNQQTLNIKVHIYRSPVSLTFFLRIAWYKLTIARKKFRIASLYHAIMRKNKWDIKNCEIKSRN